MNCILLTYVCEYGVDSTNSYLQKNAKMPLSQAHSPFNIICAISVTGSTHVSSGPVFIKHLKSNVYVTLNAIGSLRCNLCSHWLIQIFIT